MKIVVPHPAIKPHHVKHVAAGTTVAGGLAEVFLPFHLGTILLCAAGVIAIYEPMFFHHIELEIKDAD